MTLLHSNNKCADQPVHPQSLISASVFHSLRSNTCITKEAEKGFGMYKGRGGGVRIDDFINISLRPNYFIFIGYLKTGVGEAGRGSSEPPLDPPLNYTCQMHNFNI